MKYLSYDGLSHLKLLLKNALNNKSDIGHTHTKSEITDYKDYELPIASTETLGGIKVGSGLDINNGVLSATGGGTADAVDWSNVLNKPTNVSAFTNDAGYLTDIPTEYITETELNSAIESKANTSDIPTNNNQLTNGAGYQTASDVEAIIENKVSTVMNYKGSVTNYTDLPSDAKIGDTYNIINASSNNNAGDNVAWNGTSWDNLGGIIDLSGYVENSDIVEITNEEIEAIWNS